MLWNSAREEIMSNLGFPGRIYGAYGNNKTNDGPYLGYHNL